MEGSNHFIQEVCDLKHKALDTEINDVKSDIDNITNPSTGHIAVAVEGLAKQLEKLDSKINGLIMFIATTVAGALISIGAEFFKNFMK